MKSFNISVVLRGTISETLHTFMEHDASRYNFPKSKGTFRCVSPFETIVMGHSSLHAIFLRVPCLWQPLLSREPPQPKYRRPLSSVLRTLDNVALEIESLCCFMALIRLFCGADWTEPLGRSL
jgi:hypothetical protein